MRTRLQPGQFKTLKTNILNDDTKMKTFDGFLSSILESIIDGAEKADFNVVIGDTNYDKQSYPMIQVFPEISTYNGDLEYQDQFEMFFLFEKGNTKDNARRKREFLDNIKQMESAMPEIMSELGKNKRVKEYKPVDFDFLIAENSDNLMDVSR